MSKISPFEKKKKKKKIDFVVSFIFVIRNNASQMRHVASKDFVILRL